MRKELDEALVRDFPNLYADRNAPMNETCMCWGFPGDGWYDIIRRLSEKLEAIIVSIPEEDGRADYRAIQVKEKFGTLRFYMTYETPEMSGAVRDAERESVQTCEFCGKPGALRSNGGWLLTLCDKCNEERENAKNSRTVRP